VCLKNFHHCHGKHVDNISYSKGHDSPIKQPRFGNQANLHIFSKAILIYQNPYCKYSAKNHYDFPSWVKTFSTKAILYIKATSVSIYVGSAWKILLVTARLTGTLGTTF
jgi:hypothetical protein